VDKQFVKIMEVNQILDFYFIMDSQFNKIK